MKSVKGFKRFVGAAVHFFVFFILAAIVTTFCVMTFLSKLQDSIGYSFQNEEIASAAKATMSAVILVSIVFAVIDALRRKYTMHRPIEKITEATTKMTEGDFNIRIKPVPRFIVDEKFNEMIERINDMARELGGVETLRTDFIANVSHEMKTPLSIMQNYGALLTSPGLSEEKRIEYAKAITDASRRLSDMMTNILKLNRLENQQLYPKAEAYNLGEQLCECMLVYENMWNERGMEIETDIEEDVFVFADRELLALVWSNLFSNALKFTADGGRITISLKSDGKYANVKVTDTGCGISPEAGAHIFEKFYQGDTSRATEGNGLGLALVKRVVDIMQGEISVDSTLGVGSTFTVKIGREGNEA